MEPPSGCVPPGISGIGPNQEPSFPGRQPFLQIPLQQLLPVLTLILPVQFIVILLNGCGQNCRQLHHPFPLQNRPKPPSRDRRNKPFLRIHPHHRQTTADVGNHDNRISLSRLLRTLRQTTLQKSGKRSNSSSGRHGTSRRNLSASSFSNSTSSSPSLGSEYRIGEP